MANQLEEIERKRRERAAARQARKLKEQEAAARGPAADADSYVFPRGWAPVRGAEDVPGRRVRLVSWNMLAQGLVRRELFPGSNCIKFRQRLPGLRAEMASHDWDLGCFQEVDCIEEHSKTLEEGGYSYVYKKGYEAKRHGLMVAWRTRPHEGRPCFGAPVAERVLHYDDAAPMMTSSTAQHSDESPARTGNGLSRLTRNIALIVALPFAEGGSGVVVATTHLFWHPRYEYERSRQAALLLHDLQKYVRENSEVWRTWPIVLAGDLNDQPGSPAYTLLTGGGPAYQRQLDNELRESRVVHSSLEPGSTMAGNPATDGSEEETDQDRVLGAHRAAAPGELLSTCELVTMCEAAAPGGARSAYGSAYEQLELQHERAYFRDRGTEPERYDEEEHPASTDPRCTQSSEPKWTMYSQLFRLTLDYILFLPLASEGAAHRYPGITALLQLPPQSVLDPGVPRIGVCSSDHVMIGAEFAIP